MLYQKKVKILSFDKFSYKPKNESLEQSVNEFLKDNNDILLHDIKLYNNGYNVYAMIIYRELIK